MPDNKKHVNFESLKLNDEVSIWCTGKLVTGTIIEKSINSITVRHKPVQWGSDIHTITTSSIVQSWTAKPQKLIPHCFKNDLPIMG